MTNEFITNDVKVLIQHINQMANTEDADMILSVNCNLINHKAKGNIELNYNYLMHTKDSEEAKVITSISITVPYDQYLDQKEQIINAANDHLYKDILRYTNFEPENNNEYEKYKWN